MASCSEGHPTEPPRRDGLGPRPPGAASIPTRRLTQRSAFDPFVAFFCFCWSPGIRSRIRFQSSSAPTGLRPSSSERSFGSLHRCRSCRSTCLLLR